MTTRSCAECTIELTFFKRKISCFDCHDIFCTKCATNITGPGVAKGRRCFKCRTFAVPNRHDLMTLKVPDLKHYLTTKRVSTTRCSEKKDLVDLVLQFAAGQIHGYAGGAAGAAPSANIIKPSETQSRFSTLASSTDQSHSQGARQGGYRASTHTYSYPSSTREQPNSSRSHPSSHTQSWSNDRWAFVVPGAPTSSYSGNASSGGHGNGSSSSSLPSTSHQGVHSKAQANLSRARVSLDDLETEKDIDSLTVRQLKEVLSRNFIDYRGCIEKSELVQHVRHLFASHQEEKDELQKSEATGYRGGGNPTECKICMDQPIDCVLLECGHMVCCAKCGQRLHECPICRCLVSRIVRVFRS